MKNSKNILFYCGLLMSASEIWKQWTLTYVLNNGHYNWWYFPFQLCSIPMYVCLLFPLLRSLRLRRTALAFLMDFGLLGGIFAFFDTSGMYYGYLPLTVHSFSWHILLILLGLYAGNLYRSEFKCYSPVKSYLNSAALYLCCCLAATCLNLLLYHHGSINMFYISPKYDMTQKVFNQIAETFGNPASILSYISATLLGARIIHKLWAIR